MKPELTCWSTLTIKTVDQDQRIIEGVASTPETDRANDIVEPHGATFKLPLPLLWQHQADRPIGHVLDAKLTDEGIAIRARIEKGVLPYIEEAWTLIKSRLVRGLSIGFRSIQAEPLSNGGRHFKFWEWLELSAVTIPANQTASIAVVKALDLGQPLPLTVHRLPEKANSMELSAPRLSEVIAANRGLGYTRYIIAHALRGDHTSALVLAESRQDWTSTPNVVKALKAAVAAGSTSDSDWAQPLALQGLAQDFLEVVRGQSVLDRLPVRRVPLSLRVPRQTSAVGVNWVAQSAPKPVGMLAFDDITMGPKKVAGIVVVTTELVRTAGLDIERLIRNDLAASIAAFTDQQFLDPAVTANVAHPASITSALTPIASVDLSTDTAAAIAALVAGGSKLRSPYWVMRPEIAAAAAATQSVPTLPASLSGFPVLTSPDALAASLILLDAAEIVLGDGGLNVSSSQQGTLEMSDDPETDTGTVVSLWQQNLIALRAERVLNWLPARAAAASAALIDTVGY